jgi:hypothetical protein
MARDDAREMNLLDQYWDADATNRRYLARELDDGLRDAVVRFEAADDAPEPDPAFVDRLWQDLAGEPLAPMATTTAPSWNADTDDERTEPQFVTGHQASDPTSRQQSVWRRRVKQLGDTMAKVKEAKKGMAIALDWNGSATQLMIDGQPAGAPIAGEDFYRALLRIWLGEKPVQEDLKRSLLGT